MALLDGSLEDFREAAIRHYEDAHSLEQLKRLDNAGHLIGFAAECAIKHRIEVKAGASTSPAQHLPHLLSAARLRLGSRANFATMYNLLKPDIFFDWAIDSRYSQTGKITQECFSNWKLITGRLFAAAGIKAVRR